MKDLAFSVAQNNSEILRRWLRMTERGRFDKRRELTTQANDVQQLQPMLNQAQAIDEAVVGEDATLGVVLAAAGYWSDANAATETADCELLIATQKEKDHQQRAVLREAPPPRGRMPKNLTTRQRMDRKLWTKPGRALYGLRGQTVEPVFGQVKEHHGADRFMMRGIKACRGEWKLHAAVHNLRKLTPGVRPKGRKHGETGDGIASTPDPPAFYPADPLPPPAHVASAGICATGSAVQSNSAPDPQVDKRR